MRSFIGFCTAIALVCTASRALALTPAGIEAKRSGAVEYISGGVGEVEREQIRAAGEQYNLKVVTATDAGAYVGGVGLAIDDANGARLLETRTEGPLFYARIPEGRYTVRVKSNGQALERSVRVGSGAAPEVMFRIDAPVAVRAPRAVPAEDHASRDEGLSLYNLDPLAAERARKQVEYYQVQPDGTTRRIDPNAANVQPYGSDAEAAQPGTVIRIEPRPAPMPGSRAPGSMPIDDY